jgi:hypothetical protein
VPNPNLPIRHFFIAVWCSYAAEAARERERAEHEAAAAVAGKAAAATLSCTHWARWCVLEPSSHHLLELVLILVLREWLLVELLRRVALRCPLRLVSRAP